MANRAEIVLEWSIFSSRWLQAPMYVGLIIAQCFYCWKFGVELVHLVVSTNEISGKVFLGGILELIDFVMVANLIAMVVIGGYATFISKLDLGDHADRPEWLDHIDPGAIKVKLAGSLIGISSIQLLQSFIKISEPSMAAGLIQASGGIDAFYRGIFWQIMLHIVFVGSALLLAVTELVMYRRRRAGEGEGH